MATTAKKGRKPSTPSKSVKGKMTTARCSSAGTKLRKSKNPKVKSNAGRTLGKVC